jgi:metal-responsive CopG/Arc/MetJ family transcriptional regulator
MLRVHTGFMEKSKRVCVTLDPELYTDIESSRGETNRSRYVRNRLREVVPRRATTPIGRK